MGLMVCVLTICMFILPHITILLTMGIVMGGIINRLHELYKKVNIDNKLSLFLSIATLSAIIGIIAYPPFTFVFCMVILGISIFSFVKTCINIYRKMKSTKNVYNILINNDNSTTNILINLADKIVTGKIQM